MLETDASYNDGTPISTSQSAEFDPANPLEVEKVTTQQDTEESMDARIQRLGRERPPAFTTIWAELAFVFSIVMSQIITEYFVSGFNVLLPTLILDLDIPQSSSVWPATAFSLVIASTLLVFGRLGDKYGGYPVYIGGLTWLLIWSIVCGFSISPIMMDLCRALQGLGAAAYLPTGVMLIGSVYRPGPRKNIVFALYGTSAVVGFFVGIFFAGLVGQFLSWGWYFWFGAILVGITLITSILSIQNDWHERRQNNIQMDWLGAATIVPGVVLVVFAITESAHAQQRWRTPYIPALFCLGCILLFAAVYVEGWVAKSPLLPADIFTVPCMSQLVIAMLFLYGNVGILLLYGTQYFQNIMGATPLQVVAWWTPMVVGGLILSTVVGFILHLVPGRLLLVLSCLGAIGAELLLALVPEGGNYWAWVFPSCILGTVGIDLAYNLMSVFITTQLPKARQGLAGGLINSILQLGIALLLGCSDIIQSYTVEESGLKDSYKNTFWFGVACGGTALVLVAIWGRVPKAKSDLTADEKMELQREATRLSAASREQPADLEC
ncbi:putative MFS-type transporter [Cladophialophora carrionii]|uniref:Putative MFS-type transporter n=1 Tax=Cladophialophora carrionii TaxID=86049 RepID=A0A1C1CU38_9EURO|nr:putative MFS-type transporter [Cladophialophora carrionii]